MIWVPIIVCDEINFFPIAYDQMIVCPLKFGQKTPKDRGKCKKGEINLVKIAV